MGRWRTAVLPGVLVAVLLGVGAWRLVHPGEPVVLGHPVSYWIFPGLQHPKETPERSAAAFAAMDDRSVRFLIRELDWRPSKLVRAMNAAANGRLSVHFSDREDLRYQAANALARLGPRAASAVPTLERCARQGIEPRGETARGAALAALIQLRHDSMAQLLAKLRDPSDLEWTIYALAAKDLGSNATVAARVLAQAMASTNVMVRGYAAWALAAVQNPPEVVVPALRSVLGDQSEWVRRSAALGLGNLGPVAKVAWADLVPLLQDSEWGVRYSTTNALRKIDPEAAQELGVNQAATMQ